jgi:hypothetical protein
MILDVSDVVAGFATETLNVTRASAAPTYVHGKLVPAASTTFPTAAHVQPSGGRDVLRLPEGQRSREVITVWSAADLVAAAEGGPKGDRFTWNGNTYEVQVIKAWRAAGGFCETICTRVPYNGGS